MGKVILTIDDPKYCANCPLIRVAENFVTKEEYCVCIIGHYGELGDYIMNHVDINSKIRPDWCPLKEG